MLWSDNIYQGDRDMLFALIGRFEEVSAITENCSAKDIDADVIIFWDPLSTHNIVIDGIEKHRAIKYEYFCDVQQIPLQLIDRAGIWRNKPGPEQRIERAKKRGIEHFIVKTKEIYYRYFAPHLDDPDKTLVYFPFAVRKQLDGDISLCKRRPSVLASGSQWSGRKNYHPYEFRRWACRQDYVEFAIHPNIKGSGTPGGQDFFEHLIRYAGALAACDLCPVGKYFEIPMAGCVCFAQYHNEYAALGFQDHVNCVFVDKNNFEKHIRHFIKDPMTYQKIADAGKKLVLENYTSGHFAEHVYQHVWDRVHKNTMQEQQTCEIVGDFGETICE